MKYLGWFISIFVLIGFFYIYFTKYMPLKQDIRDLQQEIAMWQELLEGAKTIKGDKQSFPSDRFFSDDKLTPYAEVEILRKFDMSNKGIEIYISAPGAFTRAADLLQFLAEQHINYRNLSLYAAIDTTERFEYKFIK
jgi:hypothetical protein